ncbi:DUF2391 family protein [Halorarius litoreus]|uniref:DUF2391 family protein n=1 Tax=Halorarius litoreus TaxID=2962676 RepID=UPI0020CDCDE0|nr:DUF2391 family protein [Halorarius litoreus]
MYGNRLVDVRSLLDGEHARPGRGRDLAGEAPTGHLVAFLVVGLGLVIPIIRSVGFRDEEQDASSRSSMWVEFAEVVFQSYVAGYGVLLLLGIVGPGTPTSVVVRAGLLQVVPLAFGAGLANGVLSGGQDELSARNFPHNLGIFTLGAVFFAAPIAPTDEVDLIAAGSRWVRIGVILLITLVVVYLVLYELEFRGQAGRLHGLSPWQQVEQTCVVYAVALLVGAGLLVVLGGSGSLQFDTVVRQTIVLAFPTAIGASAAQVVLA